MSYIILVDMREKNGQIVGIGDENGNIAQFESEGKAMEIANNQSLCRSFRFIILNMDTLELKDY